MVAAWVNEGGLDDDEVVLVEGLGDFVGVGACGVFDLFGDVGGGGLRGFHCGCLRCCGFIVEDSGDAEDDDDAEDNCGDAERAFPEGLLCLVGFVHGDSLGRRVYASPTLLTLHDVVESVHFSGVWCQVAVVDAFADGACWLSEELGGLVGGDEWVGLADDPGGEGVVVVWVAGGVAGGAVVVAVHDGCGWEVVVEWADWAGSRFQNQSADPCMS